jgi:hypothetical protein
VHYRWRLSGSLAFLGIILMVLSPDCRSSAAVAAAGTAACPAAVQFVARVIDGDTVVVGAIFDRGGVFDGR